MTNSIVFILGVAMIGFIAWWFFGKHEVSQQEAVVRGDHQEIQVSVDGGYIPQAIVLKKGIPATLIFNRKDPSSCLDQVVFSDFGVHEDLPMKKDFPITIMPKEAGEFDFACGMNMIHGKVIVK
ncbi:cupredoxin domain-containing protein [Streptococcus hyovaginalis]|uniref:cupredoxin domain-containing protein n=1 Tax=Streptococcus hyovaginalis TaxID=149015 RepID=UPI002A7F9B3C|nr:cupredoxin domain-containing protein [Streptococcus hyovaginalis]MDY4511695.1 cupredoxin domain-containing protein [Streptococcus hyovaginalis]